LDVLAAAGKVIKGFGVKARDELDETKPDCVILAVAHEQFRVLGRESWLELSRTAQWLWM